MTSCLPATPSNESLASSIVLTKHAPSVDFGTYKTFFLRPEIRELADDGSDDPLPDSVATPLLAETKDQLVKRGFAPVDVKEDADLAVEMVYINTQWIATSCYSWWDGYYWGYPGYPYYPYYGGCTASTWQTHTLATTIVDLTVAKAAGTGQITSALTDGGLPDSAAAGGASAGGSTGAGGSSGEGGSAGASGSTGAGGSTGADGGPPIRLGGIWFAGVYGVVYGGTADSVQRGIDGIDQSFVQSPYLTTAK
jgi:hypothetical protein